MPARARRRRPAAFRAWRPGEALVANRFGIPEPAEAEILPAEAMAMIVMPLVGFDARGQRLGMGGGWYDRSLAFRLDRPAPPPWLVGAGFAVQRVDALPIESWDVPLDAVCTESDTTPCRLQHLTARKHYGDEVRAEDFSIADLPLRRRTLTGTQLSRRATSCEMRLGDGVLFYHSNRVPGVTACRSRPPPRIRSDQFDASEYTR